MIRYVFNDGPLYFKGAKDADAQKIGEALASVAAQNEDRLTPPAVVDAAEDEAHPLHPHFDWDNDVAGPKWRITQAQALIRAVKVEPIKEEDEPARAFLSISDRGVSYRPLQQVLDSADLQARLLASAERDLEAFQHRYRTLSDICEDVERVRQKIRRKREKNKETRPAA